MACTGACIAQHMAWAHHSNTHTDTDHHHRHFRCADDGGGGMRRGSQMVFKCKITEIVI